MPVSPDRQLSNVDTAILREIGTYCLILAGQELSQQQIIEYLSSIAGCLEYFIQRIAHTSTDKLFAFELDLANFQQFITRLESEDALIAIQDEEKIISIIEHITALFERIIQELSEAKAGQE